MIQNKYEILAEWLRDYEPIGSWLYINVSDMRAGNISLNSVSSQRYLQRYIDGSQECKLNFSIDLITNYDTGTSNTNLDALKECQQLVSWCEERQKNYELPEFDNCIVGEVEITTDVPSLSIDDTQMLAKYQILGSVNYLELRGENNGRNDKVD